MAGYLNQYMNGWCIRARIPLEDLGRLKLPHYRIRYRGGWVRTAPSTDKRSIVATLEDKEGRLVPAPTFIDACARASTMGKAIAYHLMKHNRYEAGEEVGDASKILVAA